MSLYGSFANYGFLRDTVPSDLMSQLREEVANLDMCENKFNRSLAGNIESEFKLGKHTVELENYLQSLCNQYTSSWDITNTIRDLSSDNLELYTYWVNLQKKHEFNPMHTHDGVYSFVIWLEVPYNIADELAHPSVSRSNMPRAGMFSFIYSNVFGEIREAEFPVDKTYEGTIFVFPSCLQHMVYPFSSSDKTRISISGNLRKRHE
jgi:hypothetical protein